VAFRPFLLVECPLLEWVLQVDSLVVRVCEQHIFTFSDYLFQVPRRFLLVAALVFPRLEVFPVALHLELLSSLLMA
jgi:hypothetical protein